MGVQDLLNISHTDGSLLVTRLSQNCLGSMILIWEFNTRPLKSVFARSNSESWTCVRESHNPQCHVIGSTCTCSALNKHWMVLWCKDWEGKPCTWLWAQKKLSKHVSQLSYHICADHRADWFITAVTFSWPPQRQQSKQLQEQQQTDVQLWEQRFVFILLISPASPLQPIEAKYTNS